MTQESTRAVVETDEAAIWSLRGVPESTRRRMKSQAALKGRLVPEVVNLACLFWLNSGTPLEDEIERANVA